MPSLRVVNYYQAALDPAFVRHMVEGIGLSHRDQELVWQLRRNTGDTAYYADLAGMHKKMYCDVIGNVHRREMDELLRLAQVGFRAEQASQK